MPDILKMTNAKMYIFGLLKIEIKKQVLIYVKN
jgi:hypothetical protein